MPIPSVTFGRVIISHELRFIYLIRILRASVVAIESVWMWNNFIGKRAREVLGFCYTKKLCAL